jgi:F0F1-type ATP synthase assembly protein I
VIVFLFTWLRKNGAVAGQTARLVNSTLLFACVAVGLAAGYFADRWLGTSPWLLLAGLTFGIVAAAVNFYRTIKRLNEQDRDDR